MYYIVGKGKTATSVVHYCQRHDIPYQQVGEWVPPTHQMSRIIISPGIDPKPEIIPYAKQHGISLTNDIGLFVEQSAVSRIVITGSNGKSTIVTLLVDMLRAAGHTAYAIGNIGQPVLDYLDLTNVDYFVIEVSSFQLEVLDDIPCKIAYVSNLTHDHLDRHGSIEAYAKEKAKCYLHCDIAIINEDDFYCRSMPTPYAKRIVLSAKDSLDTAVPEQKLENSFLNINTAQNDLCSGTSGLDIFPAMMGKHNRLNVLACLAITKSLGIPVEKVQTAIKQFTGLPHRCQCVMHARGVSWYDDSKATNVASTLVALESFPDNKNIMLILGGRGKGQDFSPLKPAIARHVKTVILLGEEKNHLAQLLCDIVNIQRVDTMQEAVNLAGTQSQQGDVVLLSPACSSLDMFESFEQRGHLFLAAIRNFLDDSKQAH